MVSMQISLTLVGPVGGSTIDATVNTLAKLRDEGFRRVWRAQMPFDGDLLTVLAVALREVDTIQVGSAVLPIQNQHPMLLAQRALMLNLIAGGRFLLGLGMTHQAVTEGMWGSRTTSRCAACANSLMVCNRCWRGRPPTRSVRP